MKDWVGMVCLVHWPNCGGLYAVEQIGRIATDWADCPVWVRGADWADWADWVGLVQIGAEWAIGANSADSADCADWGGLGGLGGLGRLGCSGHIGADWEGVGRFDKLGGLHGLLRLVGLEHVRQVGALRQFGQLQSGKSEVFQITQKHR